MANLPRHARARKSIPLPLFDWADQNRQSVFDPLLITRKLANRWRVSPSVLNAMAELNGFKGREVSND
jgi:hypothetical protein